MLSVSQSAEILGISTSRVRKLLDDGLLEGQTVGRVWAIREESVYDRLAKKPGAGRPVLMRTPVSLDAVNAMRESSNVLLTSVDDVLENPDALPTNAGDEPNQSGDSTVGAHSPRALHALFLECKEAFRFEPPLHELSSVSREEAGFYMAVADYFLQQKQRELIERGVY